MNMKSLRMAAMAGLAALLAGCAGGYVEGGSGGVVVAPAPYLDYGPDYDFYGGYSERGRDVRAYSDRGFQSRAAAHPGAFAAHATGGGGRIAHGGGSGGHR